MLTCTWIITFAFPYPANCTREVLLGLLHSFAQEWLGWDKFPWRITRDIHLVIDDPPVNFHYLLIQHSVTAYACHLVLTEDFVSRDDVLDMLIRERFEFVGVLRHQLIGSLQFLRDSEGKAYVPDCTGMEEGHKGVSDEEIQRRRRVFREAVERGVRETVRVLNYGSQEPDKSRPIAGHTLGAWARGDELPAPKELTVQLEEVDGQTVISPRPEEVRQFARARKTIPKLVVHGLSAQSLMTVREPGDHRPQTTDHRPGREQSGGIEQREAKETKGGTGADGSGPRMRLKVTVDAEAVGTDSATPQIAKLQEHFDEKIAGVGRDMALVKRENDDLKAMQAAGLFKFVEKVDARELPLLFAILQHGDQSKAARALKMSDTAFREKTRAWASMERPYRVMHRLITWRKRVGAKELVPFDESVLTDAGRGGDVEGVLREVLEGLENMNGGNWAQIRRELEAAIREECGG